DEERARHMKELASSLRVPQLFGPDFTYGEWARLVAEGGEIRLTKMTESFGYKEYRESLPGEFIPLLGIDGRGRLRPFMADGHPILRPGWRLMSLIPPATLDAEGSQRRNGAGRGANGGENGPGPGPGTDASSRRKSAAESLRGHSAHERQGPDTPAPDPRRAPEERLDSDPDDADPGAGPAAA